MPPLVVSMWTDNRLFADAVAIALAQADGLEVVPFGPPTAEVCLPDVVVVDASSGVESTLDLLGRRDPALAAARVVVVGIDREDEDLLELIEAGASGYLLKDATPSDLEATIRGVVEGEARCSPAVAAQLVARLAQHARERPPEIADEIEPLTERERVVLAHMARGLRNKEIGRALRITVQTVKNHVHSVLGKLKVHRRRDAILLGYRLGLLDNDDAWTGGGWDA